MIKYQACRALVEHFIFFATSLIHCKSNNAGFYLSYGNQLILKKKRFSVKIHDFAMYFLHCMMAVAAH